MLLGRVLRIRSLLNRRGATYDIHQTPTYVYFGIDENVWKTGNDEGCVYVTFYVNDMVELMAADGNGSDGDTEMEMYHYHHDEDVWYPKLLSLLTWLGY